MKNNKKVCIYTRVSTKDQTCENQLIELKRYCRACNFEIVKEFSDTASGKLKSRPELDKLLQAMRNKEFDAVVVYKFDRLGRSTQHLLQVLEEMRRKEVRLIATSQNIDTGTSMGKFFFTILSGIAELEREMIIERVNSGLARAKAEGKTLGRPKGSKDKKNRRRTLGYRARWEKERAKQGK